MSETKSPLQVIRDEHQKIMQLKHDDILLFDIVASAVLAATNPHLLEPIWVYIIGPPGSGKTESISSYGAYNRAVFCSTMTENTLASGYRDDDGKDPSILPDLDQNVLIVPDISPLMNENPAKLAKIWGDLRDAYDGQFTKATGTTGRTTYNSRFGVIMCTTGAIDSFVEEHQQLGERFMSLRVQRVPLSLKERFELGQRIHGSMDEKDKWKAHLKNVVVTQMGRACEFVTKNPGLPAMGEKATEVTIMIANLLSMLRTSPIKENAESAELPTRLAQQLITVGHAHALMDGRNEWNDDDLVLVRRIGVDTFPIAKRRLVHTLFNRGPRRPYSTKDYLLKCSRMRPDLFDQTMMQYEFMKVVEFDRDEGEKTVRGYKLTKDIYEALELTSYFEGRHMPEK